MIDNKYDIIIVGGGPAGLTAGIYAARGGMKTVLLERMGCGGQSVVTDMIENYPGFKGGIGGFELATSIKEQAERFGLGIRTEETVEIANLSKAIGGKRVKTAENQYSATAVVIATGANFRHLKVPGEVNFISKGVSYCATCDGPFFRGKKVAVVGGGNSAVQEAEFLTKFASEVTLVHRRDRLRATQVLQDKARSNPKIKFKLETVVEKISGAEKVEKLFLKNVNSGQMEEFPVDGVFIFVGTTPNTGFLGGTLKTDDGGFIITDEDMRTSSEGVFACGDVRRKLLRQVVTACGDGAVAAYAAQRYVEDLEGTSYDKTK